MTKYIYRYRPFKFIHKCDGSYHCYLIDELNRNYFHLTSSNHENDINEGNPILYLRGKKELWIGIFRYFYYFLYDKVIHNQSMKYSQCIKDRLNHGEQYLIDNELNKILETLPKHDIFFSELKFILYALSTRFLKLAIMPIKGTLIKQRDINLINLILKLINQDAYGDYLQVILDKAKYNMQLINENRLSHYFYIIDTFFNSLSNLSRSTTDIVSFSKDPTNDEMWANYANRYKGVCLIYKLNRNKHIETQKGSHKIYKVNYSDSPKFNLFHFLNRNIHDFHKLFHEAFNTHILPYKHKNITRNNMKIISFTTKSNYWRNEQEYRELLFMPNTKEQKYKLNDFKGIILGSRLEWKYKKKIIDILLKKCKKNNIQNFYIYEICKNKDGSLSKVPFLKYDHHNKKFINYTEIE